MDQLDQCFVEKVSEPVRVTDVLPAQDEGAKTVRSLEVSTVEELGKISHHIGTGSNSVRFISICQRTSWRPLQATKPMMEMIASRHDLGETFWDLVSCFYNRNLELEEAFCFPFSHSVNGDWVEIAYSFRYPEYKPKTDDYDEQWVIRHSSVYHRFNTKTFGGVFILTSPTPNSIAQAKIEKYLKDLHSDPSETVHKLHETVFSSYIPKWRWFIAYQERQNLPIRNTTFATFIDEPLNLGYDNLSTLVSLENRYLKIVTLISSCEDILKELASILAPIDPSGNVQRRLQNNLRQCKGYSQNATYLKERASSTSQLLSDTLSFRDQVLAKEQNGNMLQLNKSAVFITILTLFYVPASFAATFFGMNFFSMDEDAGRIVGSSMVWIFIVSTIALTGLTIIFYYWLLQHDGVLFQRLAPNKRVPLQMRVGGLVRRLTKTGTMGQNGASV